MESKGRSMTRFVLSAALLFASLAATATAARVHPSAGSTSAAFLKLGVGARAVAMGGAFTAVPGDPFSIYWNPAGLAYHGGRKGAGFFHSEYFQGLGQEFLSYTSPSGKGGFGLGLNYFYTPESLERRSGLNESDPLNPISSAEGRFGAYDLALSAGYGREYSPGRTYGASVKIIRQSIDKEVGTSAALDLGMLRKFSWRGAEYTAGFSVLNIGPGIKFVSRRYDLPLVFKAGVSRRLDSGALVALEADKPVDNYASFILGLEYPLAERLALRSGYRYRLYGNELGAWSGFSAGAGVFFEKLVFDYAFTPFGVLGNAHRFSISMRFGGKEPEKKPSPVSRPSGDGFRSYPLKSSQRPLTISTRGMKFEIYAVSKDCGIASMKFKTIMRGEIAGEFPVDEGSPSGVLLAGFPEGVLPLKIWRPGGVYGNVQGDIHFTFRVPKNTAVAGRPVFMFRKGGKWLEVPASPDEAELDDYLFSAAAPASQYYALGLRMGE